MKKVWTISQLKNQSRGVGLGYKELLEMAYENMRLEHKRLLVKYNNLTKLNADLHNKLEEYKGLN